MPSYVLIKKIQNCNQHYNKISKTKYFLENFRIQSFKNSPNLTRYLLLKVDFFHPTYLATLKVISAQFMEMKVVEADLKNLPNFPRIHINIDQPASSYS